MTRSGVGHPDRVAPEQPTETGAAEGSVNTGRLIRTYPPLPLYAVPSAVLCRSV